jgi:nucleotide-binding universal stress UspA family protein
MFRKILFPTDFSQHAAKTMECLPVLKKAGAEEVVLLHVIDRSAALQWQSVDLPLLERLKKGAKENLLSAKKQLEAAGLKNDVRVEVGNPFEEIVRVAREEAVSLIIMGSHGKRLSQEMLLGSVSENVLRHTPVPLLIEKFRMVEELGEQKCKFFCEEIFKKILYPTDFSDCAGKALKYVKKLRFAGAEEVVILHVQDVKKILPHLSHKMPEFNRIDQERLDKIREELVKLGFSVKTLLKEGVPFLEIEKTAAEESVFMVVLGSHGRSAVAEALLGSVSGKVVRRIKLPVLVIRRDQP